jgi:hypothetical protein
MPIGVIWHRYANVAKINSQIDAKVQRNINIF